MAADDKKAPAPTTPAPSPTADYHVAGRGSVRHNGELYAPGAALKLTPAEAEALGAAVAKGAAPPAPEAPTERKAGLYLVVGPSSLWHDGKHIAAGEKVQLEAEPARALGAAVRAA